MATILTLSLNELSTRALGRRVEHVRDDPSVPLCVKLEGAVLRTGTTAELALALVRRRPLMLFALLGWMFLGASGFPGAGSRTHAALDPAQPALSQAAAGLSAPRSRGRPQDHSGRPRQAGIARAVANHLGVISDIVEIDQDDAAEPGETIAKKLCARFGSGDFDYAGFGPSDIPVWRTARRSVIVAPSPRLLKDRIWNSQTADIVCPDDRGTGRYVDALHPGRWIKNLLIFLPLAERGQPQRPAFPGQGLSGFSAPIACRVRGIYRSTT